MWERPIHVRSGVPGCWPGMISPAFRPLGQEASRLPESDDRVKNHLFSFLVPFLLQDLCLPGWLAEFGKRRKVIARLHPHIENPERHDDDIPTSVLHSRKAVQKRCSPLPLWQQGAEDG